MENSYIWKNGIHVVYGRFDWIQLRKSLFNFYELDLSEKKLKFKLNKYQGLFNTGHHFLHFREINEKRINNLTSLTHSNFSGIKISDRDCKDVERKQYLGELLDYNRNKYFFSSYPVNKETKRLLGYLNIHEEDVIRKLEELSKKEEAVSFYDVLLKDYYLNVKKEIPDLTFDDFKKESKYFLKKEKKD